MVLAAAHTAAQAAALDMRRRANLLGLRAIMTAGGAAAHNCTSPAPVHGLPTLIAPSPPQCPAFQP